MKNKMKLWKKMLLIVCLLLIIATMILIPILVRKNADKKESKIIEELCNKASKYVNHDNYHMKRILYSGYYVTITETYKKDDKTLTTFLQNDLTNNTWKKATQYIDSENNNMYIDTSEGENIVALNTDQDIFDYYKVQNFFEDLCMEDVQDIVVKNKVCNGIDCYEVEISFNNTDTSTLYFDKNTGLIVRGINYGAVTVSEEFENVSFINDYIYKFDNVTDEDVSMPDISKYTIIGNED